MSFWAFIGTSDEIEVATITNGEAAILDTKATITLPF